MTPHHMQKDLDKLGLSQRGFALLIGSDERTIRRYIAGDRKIPLPVAMLLLAMIRGDLTRLQVESLLDGAKK